MPAGALPRLLIDDGFQPQCVMPPWSSDIVFSGANPAVLGRIRESLLQQQRFYEVADAEQTFDLLDEVLGATIPDKGRVTALADELAAVLQKLATQADFLLARYPGEEAQRAVERAGELVRTPLPAQPSQALGHVRRLAGAVAFLLELEETPC
ncbi:DUF6415 family natural product biosynthesis protein [Streptomyces mobaraensis]|uniref:Uncharacterized protein n=1 Tax=Streptomyces mobaraensis TaxID=35621 RepID=A0A5N5W1F8_STRMB|nr:DUF6415 family natural product biosynthesis protein [Streptomyces mobaraensis]KAB7835523.1 hypothetical protein FRZ00_26910 [Streptomyces mobaraensis]